MKQSISINTAFNQHGAVLVTALVFLVILTLLGITSMSTNTLEERMAGNSQDINRAFQAAESGLSAAFYDGVQGRQGDYRISGCYRSDQFKRLSLVLFGCRKQWFD